MNTRRFTSANTLRTAGNISYIIGASFIIAALAFSVLPPQITLANWGQGAIWTTSITCASPAPQDENQYNVGDTVHIRGENFDPLFTYGYRITGQPGSSDPKTVVASGVVTTDPNGFFCVAAYTVLSGDDGEYTVDVFDPANPSQTKNDNYRVNGVATSTPTSTATNTPTNTPSITPTNTPTNTVTNTPTDTPTSTPTNTPTNTPTSTSTSTPTSTDTSTPTSTPTGTLEPNTSTPTSTSTATGTLEPNTSTPTSTSTNTSVPNTSTPTNTAVPNTNTPTNTPVPATRTPTKPATLPPPPANTPSVLIPVTGINLNAGGFMGNLQVMVFNLGLSLLGFGMILKSLARRVK